MANNEKLEELDDDLLADRLQSELDAQVNHGGRKSLGGRKSAGRRMSTGPMEGMTPHSSGRRRSQGQDLVHMQQNGPSEVQQGGRGSRRRPFGPSQEHEMQKIGDGTDLGPLACDVKPQTFKQLLLALEAQYDSDIAALQANREHLESEASAIKLDDEIINSPVSAPDAEAPALSQFEPLSSSGGAEKETISADGAITPHDQQKKGRDSRISNGSSRHSRLHRLRDLLSSTSFECCIGLLILVNVIVMAFDMQYQGFDTGYALQFAGMDQPAVERWPMAKEVLGVFDMLFTLAFSVELIVRLIAFGPRFFLNLFNWLDFMVVSVSALEVLAVSGLGNTTVLRLVRLGKLARGLRLIRMSKVLDSLHLLLKCIAASVSMLMWSLLLLAVIQCTAGMVVGQLVAGYMEDNSSRESLEVRQSIFRYYGTFSYTMLTMFEVLFANWITPCRLLVDHVNEWYMVGFVIYRCLVGFCVLNVVSAVFVQQTMRVASEDADLFVQQKMRATEKYTKKLKHVFSLLDRSGDGVLEEEEFMELVDTPTMKYFLAQLELESTDFLSLFKLMDVDDSGEVTIEEFMEGCKRLKGNAKNVDLALVLAHAARMNNKLDTLLGHSDDQNGWGYGAAGSASMLGARLKTAGSTGTLGEGAMQKLASIPQTTNESDEDAESRNETEPPIKDATVFGEHATSIVPGCVGDGTAKCS